MRLKGNGVLAPMDWSHGCITMTDAKVTELSTHLASDAKVEICPSVYIPRPREIFEIEYGFKPPDTGKWQPPDLRHNDP